jgi:prepilin-type N-terminal cleavage/methylation domain-containing protein
VIRQQGFTLVELMIVLMVAGLAIGLVGPVGQRQYDKVMIVKDREILMRALESAGFQSFVQRTPAVVELKGSRFILTRANVTKEIRFNYLSFPEQILQLNSHGFWQQDLIIWVEQDEKKTVALNPDSLQLQPAKTKS